MVAPHGLNMAPINYWTPTPFIDQVKAAMITPTAGKLTLAVPLETSSHNWTLLASPDVTMVRLPALGITIRGSGTFTFDAAGTPGHGTQVALSTATPDQTSVQLVRTDHLDALNAGELFTPDAVDFITGAACLRFMDWCRTNQAAPTDTPITQWTPATAPTFNGVAVAIEYMAALCNKVGADCWFNMPSSVTIGEAVRVITLLRFLLSRGLKLHVEWSNEVWNTARAFLTGRYATSQPQGPAAYYGQQAAKLSKAIKTIPGVDMILAWKWVSPQQVQKVIDAFKAAGGPWDVVFALAFAPYPWNQSKPVSAYMPADYDGLLDGLDANRAAMAPKLKDWVAVGKANGKPVVRYEEALSPFPMSDDETAFCVQALQSPRAAAIMRQLWADADAAGCGFGCFYNSASTGVFGFAPDYGSAGYPQRQAWMRYNRRAWPMARVAA
jgi:hypothetical protein